MLSVTFALCNDQVVCAAIRWRYLRRARVPRTTGGYALNPRLLDVFGDPRRIPYLITRAHRLIPYIRTLNHGQSCALAAITTLHNGIPRTLFSGIQSSLDGKWTSNYTLDIPSILHQSTRTITSILGLTILVTRPWSNYTHPSPRVTGDRSSKERKILAYTQSRC